MCSLVKREESRSFYLFFVCFLVFGREKKHVEKLSREQNSGKMWPLVWGMPGANIAPGTNFETTALQKPSKSVDMGTSGNILAS